MDDDSLISLLPDPAVLEEEIGYTFHDKKLLRLAFVHRSYLNENKTVTHHNERLEFLGDAVLGLLAAEYLYIHYPSVPEGDLSFLRSRLVEAAACSQYIQQRQLADYMLLGRGERLNDQRGRHSIAADLFEALIGAIYLDGGLQASRHFFFGNFQSTIEEILHAPWHNWKAMLQDLCQKQYQQPPRYLVIDACGPDHSKTFTIAVEVRGQEVGRGTGTSKKEAQQAAAAAALRHFQESPWQ